MIKKLRTIALGTIAIAAVIALFATGPEVAQVWFQAANALNLTGEQAQELVGHESAVDLLKEQQELIACRGGV